MRVCFLEKMFGACFLACFTEASRENFPVNFSGKLNSVQFRLQNKFQFQFQSQFDSIQFNFVQIEFNSISISFSNSIPNFIFKINLQFQFNQPAIQISIAMSTSWGNWPNILGELARHPGGTGPHLLGEPVARCILTDSSSMASKNPKSKAWLGKNTISCFSTRKCPKK